MTDIYPFADYPTCDDYTYTMARYFTTLEVIRKLALENNIPYWTFVQSMSYPDHWYYPSESNVRMQVFSSLAYGFTGIAYFLYQSPTYEHAILSANGEKAPLYGDIAQINKEVANLGDTLKLLRSTQVLYVPGIHYEKDHGNLPNRLPDHAKQFDPKLVQSCGISNIEVAGISIHRNALLGTFTDDNGDPYFMIVNLRNARGVPAEQMKATITVTFHNSVETLYRLSRTTGKVEHIELSDGVLHLELPGGTGDLFKVNGSAFPRP